MSSLNSDLNSELVLSSKFYNELAQTPTKGYKVANIVAFCADYSKKEPFHIVTPRDYTYLGAINLALNHVAELGAIEVLGSDKIQPSLAPGYYLSIQKIAGENFIDYTAKLHACTPSLNRLETIDITDSFTPAQLNKDIKLTPGVIIIDNHFMWTCWKNEREKVHFWEPTVPTTGARMIHYEPAPTLKLLTSSNGVTTNKIRMLGDLQGLQAILAKSFISPLARSL